MASGSSAMPDSSENKTESSTGVASICLSHTSCPDTVVEAGCHKNTPDLTAESAEQQEKTVTVCQFFLMGKCHFGHRCRLYHSNPSADFPVTSLSERDGGKWEEKLEKHKRGKVNKAAKPQDGPGTEVNKKPRMRTADDVISRVLWDSSVEASHFAVGYVDRFLGVLERPFNDFNWDANPCDCDYSSELALPRHRIQYFTFRGHCVWDRNRRIDRVFGSTGQSLAPPFGEGEEEEKEGIRMHNTEEPEMHCNDRPLGTAEEALVAVGSLVESRTEEPCTSPQRTHLEEITASLSLQTASNDAKNVSQEQQQDGGDMETVADNAVNRPLTSTKQISSCHREEGAEAETRQGENLEEGKESRQNEEEQENSFPSEIQNGSTSPDKLALEQCPLSPSAQKCDGRPAKRRPTHFITFRANTPGILSGFQRLQEEVTALLPSSSPHWVSSSSLHITLCLLVLPDPAQVAAAGEILRRFAYMDRNPPVAVTFPLKLKHFNGKVLFLSPQPQLPLQQLNSGLQEAFRREGLLHRHSFNPRYHLTLAKVEYGEGERIFERVGDLRVGKGLNMGRLPVNTLHLCAMGWEEKTGFYDVLHTVTLR